MTYPDIEWPAGFYFEWAPSEGDARNPNNGTYDIDYDISIIATSCGTPWTNYVDGELFQDNATITGVPTTVGCVYTIQVRATDEMSGTTTQTFTVEIVNTNPSLCTDPDPIPDECVYVGLYYYYDLGINFCEDDVNGPYGKQDLAITTVVNANPGNTSTPWG